MKNIGCVSVRVSTPWSQSPGWKPSTTYLYGAPMKHQSTCQQAWYTPCHLPINGMCMAAITKNWLSSHVSIHCTDTDGYSTKFHKPTCRHKAGRTALHKSCIPVQHFNICILNDPECLWFMVSVSDIVSGIFGQFPAGWPVGIGSG